jgi:hypothetical protein
VGTPTIDQSTQEIELPIQLGVRNQGEGPAKVFKLSAEYMGSNLGPNRLFAVPFQAQASADIDGTNSFYPFTSHDLATGEEIQVSGSLTFNSIEQNAFINLSALADSCSGDRLFLESCRVEESNESNNRSDTLLMALPGPLVQLEPTSLDFTFFDSESGGVIITLTNTGSGNLNLSRITLTGPNPADFALSHFCPAMLTPGSNCQMEVSYNFSGALQSNANVTILSNAPGSPHNVPLIFTDAGDDNDNSVD